MVGLGPRQGQQGLLIGEAQGRMLLALVLSLLVHGLLLWGIRWQDNRGSLSSSAGEGHQRVLVSFQYPMAAASQASVSEISRIGQRLPHETRAAISAPIAHVPSHDTAETSSQKSAKFYSSDQLTAQPRALEEPVFDDFAVSGIREVGRVNLNLWIDDGGRVVDIVAIDASLPQPLLESVRESFLRVRFVAGELRGEKVAAVIRIELSHEQ